MNPPSKNYIAPLASLRFLAAMMIFVLHISGRLGVPNLRSVFALGSGVSFFYVLSGFILTYVYFKPGVAINWKSFFRKRFFRLWPLHFLMLIVVLLVAPKVQQSLSSKLIEIPLQLTLTQSWLGSVPIALGFNGPSWSVSTEFGFYLLFPFLLKLYRHIYLTFAVAVILTAGVIFVAMLTHGSTSEWLWGALKVHPFGRLIEFIFGICTAKLFLNFDSKSLSKHTFFALELMAISLLIAAPMLIKYSYQYIKPLPGARYLLSYLLHSGLFVFYGFLIWVVAHQKGILSRLLSIKALVFLGEISFAFYLVHQPVIKFFQQRPGIIDGFSPLVTFLTILFISLSFSYVAYKMVEMPFQKLGRHGAGVLFDKLKSEIKNLRIWAAFIAPITIGFLMIKFNPLPPQYIGPLKEEVADFKKNSMAINLKVENVDVVLTNYNLDIREGKFCYRMLWKVGALELETPIMRIVNIPYNEGRKTISHNVLLNPKTLKTEVGNYEYVFDGFCVPKWVLDEQKHSESIEGETQFTRIILRQKANEGYQNFLFKRDGHKEPKILLDLKRPDRFASWN